MYSNRYTRSSERCNRRLQGRARALIVAAGAVAVVACAPMPPRPSVVKRPAAVSAPPSTEVVFYPTQGQSPQQQDRDRYECYLWAVKQTGFDPSSPRLLPHQRIQVVPASPPGQDTAVGAVMGAAIGAATARPHETTEGAVVGAITGAVIGAASDTAKQTEAERRQEYYDQLEAQRLAGVEQQAQKYRRAMSACLEGHGYSVE